MVTRFLLLVGIASVLAAQDTTEILKRFVEAQKSNSVKAQNYTSSENATRYELDKQGKLKLAGTETNELIFLEGEQYKKLVARNGQPLPPTEQAKEEKKQKQTAAERRKQRRSGLFHREVNTGTEEDLLTLFDCRLAGTEMVRGRSAWIIDAVPKAGHKPANDHEKQAMSFSKKLWIDQAELVEVREIETVVGNGIFLKPGTVVHSEFEKIHDDVWQLTALDMDYRIQMFKVIGGSGRTEYRYSGFKKFDVESTITVDGVK